MRNKKSRPAGRLNADRSSPLYHDGGDDAGVGARYNRRDSLPLAGRTFERWLSAGVFPKPDISIGGKARFWKRETIERWIAERSGATPQAQEGGER